MKYIILGLMCLVTISVVFGIIFSKNKNKNNVKMDTHIEYKITSYDKKDEHFKILDKLYNDTLRIDNILNGSFFTYDNKIYCIGREYERSPLSIFTVSPNTEYISEIKTENHTLEDPKYLGYYDKCHYFISVNADEYFSIWKKSNDTNPNYNIYQCIIKLDENFKVIDIWNVKNIEGMILNKLEKNWKKLSDINDYKLTFLYNQDDFTIIEGDLQYKTFKLINSNKKINKDITNKITKHELNKPPYIRGGIPVISHDCNKYFINHLQIVKNNEINYRLNINIYDKNFELLDSIIFDSIFNKRVEYPTSSFIVGENIYISFGIEDKYTDIYKFNLYDLIIKETSGNISSSKNKLYIDREDEKLIFIN